MLLGFPGPQLHPQRLGFWKNQGHNPENTEESGELGLLPKGEPAGLTQTHNPSIQRPEPPSAHVIHGARELAIQSHTRLCST